MKSCASRISLAFCSKYALLFSCGVDLLSAGCIRSTGVLQLTASSPLSGQCIPGPICASQSCSQRSLCVRAALFFSWTGEW